MVISNLVALVVSLHISRIVQCTGIKRVMVVSTVTKGEILCRSFSLIMSHQGYEADDMEEEYEMEDPDHHIDDEFHDRDAGGSDSDMDEYDEYIVCS